VIERLNALAKEWDVWLRDNGSDGLTFSILVAWMTEHGGNWTTALALRGAYRDRVWVEHLHKHNIVTEDGRYTEDVQTWIALMNSETD
jgi:hypothetical protein